jgi:hypothetical protein
VRRNGHTIRASGILQKNNRIRLDGPVPLAPGPVDLHIRRSVKRASRRAKELDILDLAGTAKDILRNVDVDKWLDDMRNEWDRKRH